MKKLCKILLIITVVVICTRQFVFAGELTNIIKKGFEVDEKVKLSLIRVENKKIDEKMHKRMEWPSLTIKYNINDIAVSSTMRFDGNKFYRGDFAVIDRKIAESDLLASYNSALLYYLNRYFVCIYYKNMIAYLTELKKI